MQGGRRTTRNQQKTLIPQGRELLVVPPRLTTPAGAPTRSSLTPATPARTTHGSPLRSGGSRASSGSCLHRAHTCPRLSEQLGIRTAPSQRRSVFTCAGVYQPASAAVKTLGRLHAPLSNAVRLSTLVPSPRLPSSAAPPLHCCPLPARGRANAGACQPGATGRRKPLPACCSAFSSAATSGARRYSCAESSSPPPCPAHESPGAPPPRIARCWRRWPPRPCE